MRTVAELSGQAEAFRAAHQPGTPVLLPNVWDVMSARVVEEAGYHFLATSSSAVAGSLGAADTNSMDPHTVFDMVARIAGATSLPLTVDVEAGYGLESAALAAALVGAGAIGCNLEDTQHGAEGLVDADAQAERLAALRAAGDALGVPLVINARVDAVVRGLGTPEEQIAETLRRGRLYLDAGADCVYPIMLADEDGIAEVVAGLDAPVNVNLRNGGPSTARLAELGVARISYASGLYRFTQHALAEAAARLASDPQSLWA